MGMRIFFWRRTKPTICVVCCVHIITTTALVHTRTLFLSFDVCTDSFPRKNTENPYCNYHGIRGNNIISGQARAKRSILCQKKQNNKKHTKKREKKKFFDHNDP